MGEGNDGGGGVGGVGGGAGGGSGGTPSRPFEMRNVVYHPQLNVLLLFGQGNTVKVLDANSGVILQTYQLGANGEQSG